MAKGNKSPKTKVTTSFRIDPDLLASARKICRKLNAHNDEDVSLSSRLENLVDGWVNENRQYLSLK
jgi:hypothetical protein